MRASLIQLAVADDEPAAERRARAAALVRAQQGADLVVLPELWALGGFATDTWSAGAEPLDGPTSDAMSAAAAAAGVWLHAGSIVERDPDGPIYNTSLVFSPSGELVHTYRKIHRFGFDSGEAVAMGAGQEIVTAATDFGTLGLATCYDLRFPELFRALLDAGAELLVVPAAWPARRRDHWSLLARARAVEEQAYVLACNTAGTHAGVEQAGYSVVVDPWGRVLAEAGAGEEVLTVEFDPAEVARTRQEFPVHRDRLLGIPAPVQRTP
ncbi:putative amidohydrolase [Kitasatospora sp. GP30]|uniref:Carbon-nitrogen family hydrolase n=1 Tax=Kitasatospora acidiphila TaxID=2567942 RepID=A0A540W5S6_9ACTN|nr:MULTISPECIES: carbon-nitrogen family hydrolase [Kitasatospora]MDH6143251.1 putative amidohydrolase [Kitasatospora sp. GP30]TQF04350.1 carbon-nitrogen family hydrolase [Kitasatospora acidiphila]